MTIFSSLVARLVGTVFAAVILGSGVIFFTGHLWSGLCVGALALPLAWYGGEQFILKRVRKLAHAARLLSEGDLATRSGLSDETGEIGQLARTFDGMAEAMELRVKEREQVEKTLLNRSFQQTVLGALGQFAMVSSDSGAFLNQVVMLAAQTLEVEYCAVLELLPNGKFLSLKAGLGWRTGSVGKVIVPADPKTQIGFTLLAGEPVVVEGPAKDTRFRGSPFLVDHGVASGITVGISAHGRTFGILGAHTTHRRKFTEDEVHFLLSVGNVVAMAVERKRAEAELQKLAAFAQLNPNPAMELGPDGTIPYFNDAALKLSNSVGEQHPRGLLPVNATEIVQNCLMNRQSKVHLESQVGSRTLSWAFHPVVESQIVHCYVEDITERLSLEAQLRQSQKMESIGQLAAGVAHDFNNMLTIIQGHAGMLATRPGLPKGGHESAEAISFAAERAANLTRQLLLFSRKSVMQRKLLDLREVVTNLSKMLQRLLGETIQLEFVKSPKLPLVKADTGMVEQVLMNLVVNARDAMENRGGRLIIHTEAVEVDRRYTQVRPEARAGRFVCLSVTDTGCGMDAVTMSRIFEPFFTTKEAGKGTGLGLATVYGIVKQHDGWVDVASHVGKGTTFRVFLPASTAVAENHQRSVAPAGEVHRGNETILIVEDEPVLRELAQVILTDCGYRVLKAGSGVEALELWKRNTEPIDLLLTDMIMPEGVSGMDLAQKLLASKPRLKVIFASGYSMEQVDDDFLTKNRAVYLQKPYTLATLTKAVRDCLDEREFAQDQQ